MTFAVNYSEAAAKLVRSGAIEVDRFKCPEWPDLIGEVIKIKPCYPHFAFLAGRGQVQKADWRLVHRLMDLTGAPHFNMHLGPVVTDFPGMALDSDDPADRRTLFEAMTRDVLLARNEFPEDRIVLENLMWDPIPPWQVPLWALRPEVIREVIVTTGCRFLLDVAHASVTARKMGIHAQDYIQALPVERLCEMHLSGTAPGADGLWRDHAPMAEHDWALADWALDQIATGRWPRPRIIAVEYGGIGPGYEARTDEQTLRTQVPELAARIKELVR